MTALRSFLAKRRSGLAVAAGAECSIGVCHSKACDSLERYLNYPPVWLMLRTLGITGIRSWVGLMDSVVLVSVNALLRGRPV